MGGPVLPALFFPAALLYHELLLRVFDRSTPFFDLALLRILLFSIAAGLVIGLILDLLPWKTAARIIGGVLLGLGTVLFCVERGCRATFNLYYGVGFMGGMAGDVAGDFGSTVVSVVVSMIPFILLSLAPVIAFVLLRKRVVPDEGSELPVRIILTAVLVACQLTAYLLSTLGSAKSYYTYEFTTNAWRARPRPRWISLLTTRWTPPPPARAHSPPESPRTARTPPSGPSPPAPTRWISTSRRWRNRRPTRRSRACTGISAA